ncbi:hypothetical protein [Dinghuibacter silviterrae]|uniref:Uncharacterized protein n=1 Tax=Dinghuibacter silviterrae TaxID=1539049 RepID=A0A4R8DHL9_9BACT|nr:hypothetical protein [Dinghuibacter silviterrae]TDW97219.1 hypothetical protein EDB95_5064 [Dinghuibacter silviterrae]
MSSVLYSTFLTLHIAGFTLLGGILLADFVAFSRFWKVWDRDPAQALLTRQITAGFPPLIRIGAAVLILAGIGMMALTHGIFGEQTWFRIKIVLVVLIIITGIIGGRLQGVQLKKLLDADSTAKTPAVLRARIRFFHIVQITLVMGVFLLSAFRFN